MLEIKREKKPVTIFGEVYQLTKASNEARLQYLSEHDKVIDEMKLVEKERHYLNAACDYCLSMGLPLKIATQLDFKELISIAEFVNEKKN